MKIQGIDHIEFYVSDLQRWAADLCSAFGFRIRGHGGPDTGLSGRRSHA
jgi:4-hydroxymandelate synthase